MRGTIVRIGITGAGALLALGIVTTAPAGASKPDTDRPVAGVCTPSERIQGNSSSDPDGMSNGGTDKPGCPGDFDDRDGNNGCGNDADREDDNNGNCGKKPARDKTKPARTNASTSTTSTSTTTTTTTTTLGGTDAGATVAASGTTQVGQPAGTADVAATRAGDTAGQADAVTAAEPRTEVLGETLERPSALARTGAGVGGLALLGGLLCSGGRLAVLARRFLRID